MSAGGTVLAERRLETPGACVEYFQTEPPPDRTLTRSIRRGEVQRPKCGLARVDVPPQDLASDDIALQMVSRDVGDLVEKALDAAHITPTEAARKMGISLSLLGRQLQNIDNQHLSLQRLYRLPDAFWRELWVLVAERRKLARVRRRVVFEVA